MYVKAYISSTAPKQNNNCTNGARHFLDGQKNTQKNYVHVPHTAMIVNTEHFHSTGKASLNSTWITLDRKSQSKH